jgi:anti-sigma B factor antagonist
MQLKIHSIDGGRANIAASGSVSMSHQGANADPLRDLLGESAYAQQILLDMADVDMIDSSGLGWLVACQKRIVEKGGSLVIHSSPPMVHKVIKLVRLDRVLKVAANKQEAEALLQGDVA